MGRTQYLKISLCIIILLLISLGPYSSFIPFAADISSSDKPHSIIWSFIQENFIYIKYLIMALCVISIPSFKYSFAPVFLLNLLFLAFNWFCSIDSPGGLYNYNTHINFFMSGVSLALIIYHLKPSLEQKVNDRLIQFCKCYVLTFYLQSGLSKLIFAGTAWLLSGRTAWVFALEMGTNIGRILANYPVIFSIGSFLIVAFEILIAPLYLIGFHRKYLIIGAITLHLSVFLVMGISFWHMWLLYPVIFYDDLFKKERFKQSLRRNT